MNNNTKGLLYAGFTAILWGFLAIALKIALYKLNPVTVVWFRFCIAFIVLLILLLLFDKKLVKSVKALPRLVFLAGLLLGLNYLGFISGIQKTTPGIAQVFIQIGPVSLAIVGILFFKEKIGWRHFVGFILLLSGFALFYTQQDTGSGESAANLRLGVLYVSLGGLSWAGFSTLQKIMLVKHNPNHLNLVIFGFCVLIFLPFVEFSKLSGLSFNDWLLLIFLGLNTLMAYGSLALALKYTEANKISMIITLNPILTFVLMAILEILAVSWIDYENFSYLSIFGAILALCGVSIVVLRRRKQV